MEISNGFRHNKTSFTRRGLFALALGVGIGLSGAASAHGNGGGGHGGGSNTGGHSSTNNGGMGRGGIGGGFGGMGSGANHSAGMGGSTGGQGQKGMNPGGYAGGYGGLHGWGGLGSYGSISATATASATSISGRTTGSVRTTATAQAQTGGYYTKTPRSMPTPAVRTPNPPATKVAAHPKSSRHYGYDQGSYAIASAWASASASSANGQVTARAQSGAIAKAGLQGAKPSKARTFAVPRTPNPPTNQVADNSHQKQSHKGVQQNTNVTRDAIRINAQPQSFVASTDNVQTGSRRKGSEQTNTYAQINPNSASYLKSMDITKTDTSLWGGAIKGAVDIQSGVTYGSVSGPASIGTTSISGFAAYTGGVHYDSNGNLVGGYTFNSGSQENINGYTVTNSYSASMPQGGGSDSSTNNSNTGTKQNNRYSNGSYQVASNGYADTPDRSKSDYGMGENASRTISASLPTRSLSQTISRPYTYSA